MSFAESDGPKSCYNLTDQHQCLQSVYKFIDVSGDYSLSSAEITRATKLIVYYFLLNKEGLTWSDELATAKLMTSAFAPTISELFIKNYDFDNSKTLTIDELNVDFENFEFESTISLLNQDFSNFSLLDIFETWSKFFGG